MKQRFNVDVRTLSEVVRIFPDRQEVKVHDLAGDRIYTENYDYLVLSPGANPIIPPLPGVDLPNVFTVRNVPDSDKIKLWAKEEKPGQAVVIGGGFIGLEIAENLKHRGIHVTVVEMADQVMAPLDREMANLVHRYLRQHQIELFLNDAAVSFLGEGRVREVQLKSGRSLSADMVVLGIGVRPENKLAREAGLKIGVTGGIMVNEYLQTSDPKIYAIGDAIQVRSFVGWNEVLIPLAGPANKQGRLVADNIMGRPAPYEGTLGTAIAKIFDLVVANTGLNEKSLRRLGLDYEVSYTHPAPYATYYPGGRNMSLKLLFNSSNGAILGAQVVGYEGVDKRIDVLATCIRKGLTVFDLQELEMAYAPPFSSAKDPVNMAGYVAVNIIKGDMEVVHWHQVESLVKAGALVVDVRTPEEFRRGAIPNAVNIPVDELRERIHEIPPRDKMVLLYCRVGLRGYLALRILKQHGYNQVKNLSGGYLTYEAAMERDFN